MKRLLNTFLFTLVTLTLLAVPAKRQKRTITLPDGTQVETTFCGDEHVHFYQAADGRRFQLRDNHFLQVDADSLTQVWNTRLEARRKVQSARRAVMRKATWGAASNPICGSKKALVILVNFSDKKMTYTQSDYNDIFNKVGYNQHSFGGSVHDYFYSQSYGQFDLNFDVVGPVTVSKSYSYYGQNDDGDNDMYPATMVGEAVKLVDSQVNYADYDWDGDGYVDQVYVIYAGYGEAQAESLTNTIWPHEYELSSASYYNDGNGAVKLDGVTIDTYACSCELSGSSGSDIDGIGTACHEFSHCMAIPDMYDTNYEAFGMATWDIMDMGSYNGANDCGECPAPYTSYERMYCGWLTPTVLDTPCNVTEMPAITSQPVAYMIRNDNYSNEYYLLENHQYESWDRYAYGHGMLVLHVDFNSTAWFNNEVNTTASHQRMTIIAADNSYNYNSESSLAGDPWPGTKNKTELTNTSTPAATLYNKNTDGTKFMNHPITGITENNNLISFVFDGGPQVDAPEALAAEEITSDGFTAHWTAVEGAQYYNLQLTQKTPVTDLSEQALLVEDFSGFNNGTTTDGTTDVSGSLNTYTNTTGWSGSKVFKSRYSAAKLGSSNYTGYLITPQLSAQCDSVTVLFGYLAYASSNTGKLDSGSLNLSLIDASFNYASIVPASATDTAYTCVTIPASESFKLRLGTSQKRAYVTYLAVFDGVYTQTELLEQRDKAPRRVVTNQTFQVQDTQYTITGLNPENTYIYKVNAVTTEGTSPWSNSITVNLEQEDPDALASPIAVPRTGILYNLSGQRVGEHYHGIVIQDGRKLLK